ncbi:Scramblase [Lipomyces oligophaga]|uniref:Scramblase n=1 Tax=Lipomyces oligophaga TaxID=45792 RepID=UPI0034CEFF1A
MADSKNSYDYDPSEVHTRIHPDANVYDNQGVLTMNDAASYILSQPALVIERQIEFMNVFLGFEQANRYALLDINGNHIGYMEEVDLGFVKAIMRQVYRLHRPFTVNILDRHGSIILRLRRPFSIINSYVSVSVPESEYSEERIIGEAQQSWHLWRRRYNLFLKENGDNFNQFAAIDAPFLSFQFELHDEDQQIMGSVERNWVGLGRELFTDTGVYILKMDAVSSDDYGVQHRTSGMSLDQRAVMLGCAVSIDFDYFSRHSRPGGGFFGPTDDI